MISSPTGIRIIDCTKCGYRHPETRAHCVYCGRASMFGHDFCEPS